MIFALGPIGENKILWDDCQAWEELPHGAAALEAQSRDVVEATHGYGAVYPFPHDERLWQHDKQLLSSTAQTIGDFYDLSRGWALLEKVKQKAPQLILPHTEKLVISQKSKASRSYGKMIERRARYQAKPWKIANPRSGAATQ